MQKTCTNKEETYLVLWYMHSEDLLHIPQDKHSLVHAKLHYKLRLNHKIQDTDRYIFYSHKLIYNRNRCLSYILVYNLVETQYNLLSTNIYNCYCQE